MSLRLVVIFLIFIPTYVFSQRNFDKYSEFGFTAAFVNYSGDLAEGNLALRETKIGYGFFYRRTFSRSFSMKGQVYFGQLSGDDINNPSLKFRQYRFYSPIAEISAVAEWHFLGHSRYGEVGASLFRFSPFVFLGGGVTIAKPRTEYYGTGPTPFPESDPQTIFPSIPMGLGGKFHLDERISINLELGWRPVMSDKLDGVSINGNPENNDWYIFAGAGLSYMFSNPYK